MSDTKVLERYQREIESLRCSLLFDEEVEDMPDGKLSAHYLAAIAHLELAESYMRLAKEFI